MPIGGQWAPDNMGIGPIPAFAALSTESVASEKLRPPAILGIDASEKAGEEDAREQQSQSGTAEDEDREHVASEGTNSDEPTEENARNVDYFA